MHCATASQYYHDTALHKASEHGHTETVRELLQRGANPNQPNCVSYILTQLVNAENLHVCIFNL